MPSDYRIDDSQKTIWTVSDGQVTDVDLLGMYSRMRADVGFCADYNELCDFTRASDVQISTHVVRRLALETPFVKEARHAIVASGPVVYGLARMYQAYVESGGQERVRVFTDLKAAADWLGVEPNGTAA